MHVNMLLMISKLSQKFPNLRKNNNYYVDHIPNVIIRRNVHVFYYSAGDLVTA